MSKLDEWLATRPESVRKLAEEFPLGTIIESDGVTLYHLGYTEDDALIFTPINPAEDYDGAIAAKVYVCASHLRKQ